MTNLPLPLPPPDKRTRFGEQNGQSKLKEAQVQQIRSLIKLGEPNGMIAKQFEVSTSVIWSIRKGVTWRHLGPI